MSLFRVAALPILLSAAVALTAFPTELFAMQIADAEAASFHGAITPLQLQNIASAQLTDWATALPVIGLDQSIGIPAVAQSAGVHQDAAKLVSQTLLSLIRSPAASRLHETPETRRKLVSHLGEENVARIEALSRNPKIQEALARIVTGSKSATGAAQDAAGLVSRLDALIDGASQNETTALETSVGASANGRAEFPDSWRLHKGASPIAYGLPPEAVSAIVAASKGDYTFALLSKQVTGKDRLVVLMGEHHLKSAENKELGLAVLKHFPIRGLESYQGLANYHPTTMLGRIFKSLSNRIVAQKISRIGRAHHNSSIFDASDQAIREDPIRNTVKILQSLGTEQQLQMLTQAEALSEKELDERLIMGGHEVYTKRELKEILAAMLAKIDLSARFLSENKLQIFYLELGHRPDFAEFLNLWRKPILKILKASTAVCIILGLLSVLFHDPTAIKNAAHAAALTGVVLSFWQLHEAGDFFYRHFEQRRWFTSIFGGVLHARNKTMVANIDKIFEDHADVDKMVGIVGMAHVPGMKRMLVETHGYRAILSSTGR